MPDLIARSPVGHALHEAATADWYKSLRQGATHSNPSPVASSAQAHILPLSSPPINTNGLPSTLPPRLPPQPLLIAPCPSPRNQHEQCQPASKHVRQQGSRERSQASTSVEQAGSHPWFPAAPEPRRPRVLGYTTTATGRYAQKKVHYVNKPIPQHIQNPPHVLASTRSTALASFRS